MYLILFHWIQIVSEPSQKWLMVMYVSFYIVFAIFSSIHHLKNWAKYNYISTTKINLSYLKFPQMEGTQKYDLPNGIRNIVKADDFCMLCKSKREETKRRSIDRTVAWQRWMTWRAPHFGFCYFLASQYGWSYSSFKKSFKVRAIF